MRHGTPVLSAAALGSRGGPKRAAPGSREPGVPRRVAAKVLPLAARPCYNAALGSCAPPFPTPR
eukprot:10587980-Alexandrium_andersonii.AAC.1